MPLVDDDFVHTISDNESVPDLDESLPSTSKKRKRDENHANNANAKKSKKIKKDKKDSKSTVGKIDYASEEKDNELSHDHSRVEEDADMDSDFEFVIGDANTGLLEDFDGWEKKEGKKEQANGAMTVDDIIERRLQKQGKNGATKVDGALENQQQEQEEEEFGGFDEDDELLAEDGFGMGATGDDETKEDNEDSDAEEADGNNESDDESEAEPVAHPDDLEAGNDSDSEVEDDAEAQRRKDFFAPESNLDGSKGSNSKVLGSFQAMNLSRPILKGLSSVGFTEPTPIQAKTIPVALLGKDVVGSAVTGSGKTAAFMIPILERLLYRPKKVPTTRVAVLMPTRELAVQCFNVSKKLASFTDITFAQIVGGFSLREQEAVLKTRPDVIIATPGRFIDHVKNSPSFAVDTLEILVLDEADRMLEDGFADELNEILTSIPKSRQTMLFSATMTESVDKLIRVGLNRPVRLMVDAKKSTVAGLVQEFIRLRPGKEEKRLAYLMYLCEKVYTDRVIVFFRSKREAHRVRIIFGLCGFKAAELHGSMSQEQRIAAIESFRASTSTHLLCTDLASRGLDIRSVSVVLNYTTPATHEIYLHRVGRTARAGRTGRACTLAAEPDRRVVRAAVKSARAQGAVVQSRLVPSDAVDAWDAKLTALHDDIEAVLEEEKDERALGAMERDVRKGENMVKHEAEIAARPKREWFQSESAKKASKARGAAEAGVGKGAKKGEKLSHKKKKQLEDRDDRKSVREWKKGKGDAANAGKPKSKGASKGKPRGKPLGKPVGKPAGKFKGKVGGKR